MQEALRVLQRERKYNTRLYQFLEDMYPWQRKMANLSSEYSVIGCVASNQTGKTESVSAITCVHLLGDYPDWWEGKKFKHAPTVVMSGVNSNHNRIVLQEKMFGTANRNIESDVGTGMLPLDRIVPNSIIKARDGGITGCQIIHSSGKSSVLEFRAYEQGREAIQGFPADMIVIDEQPKDDFWSEALVRTAARDGLVMCAFTPLKGRTGLVDKFWILPDHPDAPKDEHGAKWRHNQTDKWFMIRATWEDIGHMTEESKRTQRAGMMDFEIATRTMGIPMSGEGRIYPHNRVDITFGDLTTVPPDSDSLIGVDFGFTKDPAAAILVRYDRNRDIVYVTGEWKQNINSLREHAQGIWSLDPYCPVTYPRDGNNYSDFKGGATTAATLRDEHGVLLLPEPFLNPVGADGKKQNHLMPGFTEINTRFREGRLKIHDSCEKLLDEIDNYSHDDKMRPLPRSEDHLCDAFRYAVMSVIQGLGHNSRPKGFWYDKEEEENFFYQTY